MSETPIMKRRAFLSLVGAAPLAAVKAPAVEAQADPEAFAREFFLRGAIRGPILTPRQVREMEDMLPLALEPNPLSARRRLLDELSAERADE